ncbi:MAG TPA: hypothetical protein VHM64_15195 [Candidatus Binatia bacterium]|nr:hypothetical protein [Candidatus Binatia bacterium]
MSSNTHEISHSGHCRECKKHVRQMLTALFGECRVDYSFPWSAKPEDYASTAIGKSLEAVRAALGDLRGYRDFIKSPLMPPCDYYLPEQKRIVEFDESQHFTRQRSITLSLYPEDLKFGFPLERWRDLCRRIDATDDTPFDRDERRAWYDVLRDLVPISHGFKPTIRLYAGDYAWCSLNAENASDLATILGFFKS